MSRSSRTVQVDLLAHHEQVLPQDGFLRLPDRAGVLTDRHAGEDGVSPGAAHSPTISGTTVTSRS